MGMLHPFALSLSSQGWATKADFTRAERKLLKSLIVTTPIERQTESVKVLRLNWSGGQSTRVLLHVLAASFSSG